MNEYAVNHNHKRFALSVIRIFRITASVLTGLSLLIACPLLMMSVTTGELNPAVFLVPLATLIIFSPVIFTALWLARNIKRKFVDILSYQPET